MGNEWLDKIDDLLYEIRVESNHIRRYALIEEFYKMFKERLINELNRQKSDKDN